MAVIIKKGDLLQASEPIIGHQVNCQGVMGSGIAKAIWVRYR
ncbi:UNVERIFIED_CONTAM: O-acetyl-ADP-ribose deacetylase (regulator of RNase III) [Brevibacillus sp. OAP136]